MQVVLPNNWEPRAYQRRLWAALEGGCRRAVAVWHRRAGKDEVALHWAAVASHERVGNYWHMLPKANQARKAIWDAVNPHTGKRRIDEAFPHAVRETTREQDMLIRFHCGSTWQVVGSDNFDALVGSPPVGIVFSEWSLADPGAWAMLRPILLENKGWALFIYTSRGRNHGYTTLKTAQDDPSYFAEVLRASESGVFTPDQLARERREYESEYGVDDGGAMYEQEYECSFDAALIGSYFGRQISDADKEGRIGRVPWDPLLPVHTAWDLGVGDSTAIWFAQMAGREVRLIDFYRASGQGLEHYAKVLRERPYTYARPIWPHDGDHKEIGTGRTRKDTWRALMPRMEPIILKNGPLADGINAARQLLPRCYFDAVKCEYGVEALRQYRREWDDEKKVFKDHPLHDWTSHPADAFRYLALGVREPRDGVTMQVQAITEDTPRGVYVSRRFQAVAEMD